MYESHSKPSCLELVYILITTLEQLVYKFALTEHIIVFILTFITLSRCVEGSKIIYKKPLFIEGHHQNYGAGTNSFQKCKIFACCACTKHVYSSD